MTVSGSPVCKAAGDDANHRKRPVGEDGYCYSCFYSRRRSKRRTARLGSVRRKYGLTEEQLEALVKDQTGPDGRLRCRCGRPLGVSKPYAVDHNHRCVRCAGKGCQYCVRGLLHQYCNEFLGRIGDRPEALINLAWHLVAEPAQAVLDAMERKRT